MNPIIIVSFLLLAYFLKYTIHYLKIYSRLRKQKNIVFGKVIQMGDPKGGWRLKIPKVNYEFNSQHYNQFVKYPFLVFFINKVGDECELLIDQDNPTICVMSSISYLLIDLSLIILFCCVLIYFTFN